MDLAFSPAGDLLAGAMADRSVRVWDLKTGAERILSGHSDLVYQVEFSPDGRTLVSSSYDTTIRLWAVGSWQSRVFRGHSTSADSISFRADGALIASMERNGTIKLWKPTLDLAPSQQEVTSRLHQATTATIGTHDRLQTVSR